ncbi:MAG: hypothetical protein R2711_16890 [Acidimicrobiales bacterium]
MDLRRWRAVERRRTACRGRYLVDPDADPAELEAEAEAAEVAGDLDPPCDGGSRPG